MTEVKRRVLRVISEWDPIHLMAHAPDDEYEAEADKILQLLTQTENAAGLAAGIAEVFTQAFGENRFTASRTECLRVAREIIASVSMKGE